MLSPAKSQRLKFHANEFGTVGFSILGADGNASHNPKIQEEIKKVQLEASGVIRQERNRNSTLLSLDHRTIAQTVLHPGKHNAVYTGKPNHRVRDGATEKPNIRKHPPLGVLGSTRESSP